MKKLYLFFFFLFFLKTSSFSQNFKSEIPQVPSSFFFDKIKIEIDSKTRKEIQNEVDALHTNRKFFELILDRVTLYFPTIERILNEENMPNDFKYLSIQESALISTAKSSSNAFGFWQFKEETAKDHGLVINRSVDERSNIVSSTYAACSYLKENNFYFDNWLYSLLSYMTGLTGAKSITDKKMYGSQRMQINEDTHWYIKKFIAHKIAFQDELNHKHSQDLILKEYSNNNNRSLKKISKALNLDHEMLSSYNRWIKSDLIPNDKNYTLMIPINEDNLISLSERKNEMMEEPERKTYELKSAIDQKIFSLASIEIIILNGLPAIIADSLDSFNSISNLYNISIEKIKDYNDLDARQKITSGNIYYLTRKRKKGKVMTYMPKKNDSLWEISQKFGIRLENLKKLNNIRNNELPSNKKLILRKGFLK